ncbi:MAG: ZIP family metal transporter [Nanoarchaeota archaeon]|nr:ZIP family metal transporter [Nanoarchaeota archaeon]
MIYFLILLIFTGLAQILGALFTGLILKIFVERERILVYIEAGLMVLISVLLIYEGLKITIYSLLAVLLGIIFIYILNRSIPHKHGTKAERLSWLVFMAMCFHELPEGLAFGTAFLVDPSLGLITAILIALHNIPEGSIIMMPYLLGKKFKKGMKKTIVTQVLYYLGGLVAYVFLINLSEIIQSLAMTFAAGLMLFIVVEEILMVRKR